MTGEVNHWYVWSTFLPYIKLLYLPERTRHPREREEKVVNKYGPFDPIVDDLHMLSLRTILLALQNMLSRSNHREVLWNEQLEDFITCVPSYVPKSLAPQARELVKIVGSDGFQLQPPRLVNLVKAKLAKTHFGLVSVLSRSVGEIVTEVLCNT